MREGDILVGRRVRNCQFAYQENEASNASERRLRAPNWLSTGWVRASVCLAFALVSSSVDAGASEEYLYRQGRDYPVTVKRPSLGRRACSFREPVCVHAQGGTSDALVLETLEELERARTTLVRALGLPAPLGDGSLGGTSAFDVYLVDGVPGAMDVTSAVITERDEPVIGELDRASAFALLDRHVTGCARRNLVTRAVASAIGYGIDAAEDASIRESRAAYLAELVAPCDEVTRPLVDDFQRHPERAVFGHASPTTGLLFPWYLDTSLGAGHPGVLPYALTATSRQRTPSGSFTFLDEPDIFDSLRGALFTKSPPQKLSDVLLDFAVARAFVGDRDDGMHLPETRWTGKSGRVRFEWSVPFTSLPRSLAPRSPIAPTGASYLWVDLQGAPKGSRVTFRAEWEPPVLFRWAIVRVNRDGTEASRVTVTGQDGTTVAERVIEGIDDLAGLLIVGTNTGDVGLQRPFDPDEQPAEPHGYVVTLWRE